MHPRVSLHQVAMVSQPSADFIAHCGKIGVPQMTLVTPVLSQPGDLDAAQAELAKGGPRVATVNHMFAHHPDIERDEGEAHARLVTAIDMAADLGAGQIYLITGGRGSLGWEAAAQRFAQLIGPGKAYGQAQGVRLLVENAGAFNVDIHLPLTLDDAVALAEIAGIGVCIELHACWFEGGLKDKLRRAMPLAGLVQVSDYVPGDRTTPCRAVPGDGMIPLERVLGDVLEAGYTGLFDLELVGPRIAQEGPREASKRAAERLSELLIKLGA